jgi:Family of unknown function (DUF6011)
MAESLFAKMAFAEKEKEQEAQAFMSDPDIGRAAEFRLYASWLMAGDAIFTVEIPERYRATEAPHYTYRVQLVPANNGWKEAHFVKLLTGPSNESDYTYVGKLVDGQVRTTGKSTYSMDSFPVSLLNKVLKRLFADELHVIEAFGFRIHHEGRCGCCGRLLTTPESVTRGIGPVCFERLA